MASIDSPAAEHPAVDPGRRAVVIRDLTVPVLVLGSVQPDDVVDHGAGVTVVRRRSGGGAVLVEPGGTLWVDVTVPAGDPLWDPDVRRSFHWLGEAWTAALGRLGIEAAWHDGGLESTPWSRLICFAGLGPGEVTVAGRKVVGLSQRRTRAGSLFQCLALLEWDPAAVVGLLALAPDKAAAALADVAGRAAGVGAGRGQNLLDAFLAELGAR